VTRSRRKPPDYVCVHEAGHAVAVLALGLPLLWVSAQPDDEGRAGACTWDNTNASPLQRAAISLAGIVAEENVLPGRILSGIGTDLARAEAQGPNDLVPLVDFLLEAWKLSRRLLKGRTADIRAVARVLGEADRLDGDQVAKILAGATVASGSGG
jgi:hypothetical protein